VIRLLLLGSILSLNLYAQEVSTQPCSDKEQELEIQQAKCKELSDKVLKKACKTRAKEIKKDLKSCKRIIKASRKEARKTVKKLNLDQKQKLKCHKILSKARGKADKNEVVPDRLLKKLEKNKCIGLE
jgi:hypothetical protein